MLKGEDLRAMSIEELKKFERELEEDLTIVRWHIRAILAGKKFQYETQKESEPPK